MKILSSPLIHKLLLRSDLARVGVETSPGSSVTSKEIEWQRIGFIKLPLEPPFRITSFKDLLFIFINHEALRLLCCIIWLIVCGMIECFMAQLSDIRYSYVYQGKTPALQDLLFDAFPYISNVQLVNYLLETTVICTVVGLAIQLPDWTTRWTVLRRWCFIMGWLYLFRSVTIVVTTLPSPLKDGCVPPSLSLHGTAGQRFGAFFETVAGNDQSCGDNIFSGHTCVMTSCALAWRIHSRAHRFYGWVLYLIATAGILMIIFTHYHYTIDVLLALFIVYVSWYIYMRSIRDATMKYVLGYGDHPEMNVFHSHAGQLAKQKYQYLVNQPHPLGSRLLMWICVYADGLDIRLRSLGVFDSRGKWRHPDGKIEQPGIEC
ncbi:sphingomyelin synthase [Umbelopsis sp. WA50703]